MGFSNDFSLGPFRLSSLLDWRKGGLGVNLTNDYFYGSGLAKDTLLAQNQLANFRKGIDVWVENTGFLKLRELTLSYDLPAAMASTLFNGRAQAFDLRIKPGAQRLDRGVLGPRGVRESCRDAVPEIVRRRP